MADRPNIFIIVSDDHRWCDAGCYGSPDVHMPNLGRLAREGMRFDRAYTPAPICAPSRMSLYTGLYPVRSGGWPNHSRVYDGTRSVVHHLTGLGYRVGLHGKRHIRPPEAFPFEGVEDIALGINVIAATMDPRKAEVRFLVEPDPDAVQTVRNGPDPDVTFRVPGQGWETFLPGRPVYGNELPDDACLSFNYEKGTWMLFTNYEGTAATIYQRQYTRLLSDWSVWQESETRFDDPTGTNRTLMRTPWIRLSEQVQDFNRLWRITFLGRYLSSQQDMGGEVYEAGDVRVRLYFDYERDWSQEKLFRIQDFRANQFNSSSLRAERFQFEMSPIRGRCQSVKIEIEEVDSDGTLDGVTYTLGHGFEIVSADFKIGVSPQRALLPKAVK